MSSKGRSLCDTPFYYVARFDAMKKHPFYGKYPMAERTEALGTAQSNEKCISIKNKTVIILYYIEKQLHSIMKIKNKFSLL